jgi:deoxyribonuclease-4
MYLGSHVSAAGKNGIIKAIEQTIKMNGTALQIFVSNRVGKGTKVIAEQEKKDIISLLNTKIKLVIHSPYTLNFANEFNEDYWGFKLILKELQIANDICAIGCVIHMGKYLKLDIKDANINFIKSIKFIVKRMKAEKINCKLILETPAGQGTEMYVILEDFIKMYNSFTDNEKNYIGICIDTCHIYSAGYNIKDYLEGFNKLLGYKYLTVIHFNDSKKEKGAKVDRHENIGEGTIDKKDLFFAIKVGKKHKIPIILETPDVNKYQKEIKHIRDEA